MPILPTVRTKSLIHVNLAPIDMKVAIRHAATIATPCLSRRRSVQSPTLGALK